VFAKILVKNAHRKITYNVIRLAEVAKKQALNCRFCQKITDTKKILN
jgi:hypothetical protein